MTSMHNCTDLAVQSGAGQISLCWTDRRLFKLGTPRTRPLALAPLIVTGLLLLLAGCKVGPDFATPNASVAANWLESRDASVHSDRKDDQNWWTVYHDPTLDRLIDLAYQQNLTLMAAGTRVLEARAKLGVAIGEFYPQTQQIGSERRLQSGQPGRSDLEPDARARELLARFAWHADRVGAGFLG